MKENDEVEVEIEEIEQEELQEEEEQVADAEEPEEDESSEEDSSEEQDESQEDDDEEVVVTIGDEEPEEEVAEAPEWVRELRKTNRELKKENKRLQQQTAPAPAQEAIVLGEKPTFESVGYDEEEFETQLASWHERKRKIDDQAEQAKVEAAAHAKAWQATLDTYEEKKKSLNVSNYDEAEENVKDVLSQDQQSIILIGAKNPALVVAAVGRNTDKLKELSQITDPIKFAFAIGDMENKLKTSKAARPRTKPETKLKGSGAVTSSVEKTLERLEAEADKTGDRSKVIAFNKAQKQKAA
jgi:hypothetical protein